MRKDEWKGSVTLAFFEVGIASSCAASQLHGCRTYGIRAAGVECSGLTMPVASAIPGVFWTVDHPCDLQVRVSNHSPRVDPRGGVARTGSEWRWRNT